MASRVVVITIILLVVMAGCSEQEETPAQVATSAMVLTAADIEAGKAVAASCAKCHGLDGKSTGPEMPHLAAQNRRYMVFALKAYKEKARGSAVMQAAIGSLTDADMVNVVGYYTSLKPVESAAPAPAVPIPRPAGALDRAVAAGKAAAAACTGCHGATGHSSATGTPHLAGQDVQYLVTAMRAYKDGSRKHVMMQGAVAALGDVDVDNLAAFYSVQEPKVPKFRKLISPEEWAERCDRCHEPSIENPLHAFPKIKGLPAAYITKALKTYQDESSRTSTMMHAMALPLSEAEIQGVAAYYAQQEVR